MQRHSALWVHSVSGVAGLHRCRDRRGDRSAGPAEFVKSPGTDTAANQVSAANPMAHGAVAGVESAMERSDNGFVDRTGTSEARSMNSGVVGLSVSGLIQAGG